MVQQIVDRNGHPVPYGKVQKTLTETFIEGALPTWLEASSGTASFVTPDAGFGYCQVQSGASTGDVGELRTAFEFDTQYFREIRWTMEGLHFSHDDTAMTTFMSINASGVGCNMLHDQTDDTAYIRTFGPGATDTFVPYRMKNDGEGTRRRNLTLVLFPQDNEVQVFEDDQMVAYREASFISTGLVRAKVGIVTREAVAKSLFVPQAKLTLVHN